MRQLQTIISFVIAFFKRGLTLARIVRIELTTDGLQNRCSTAELSWRYSNCLVKPANWPWSERLLREERSVCKKLQSTVQQKKHYEPK